MRSDKFKTRIIELFKRNPALSRRELSDITGAKYGHVRNVVSRYVRGEVTRRGSPSGVGFGFHGWYWSGLWDSNLYGLCVGVVVANRNGMKRFQGESFSFLLHRNGRVSLFPIVDDEGVWRRELLGWLKLWVGNDGLAEALLKPANFGLVGSKSWAVHTPGVPLKVNFRVKGVGSLKTDPTPFPDGTSEFELDPNLERRLLMIERSVIRLADSLEKLVGMLGEGDGVVVGVDRGVGRV
jgi:hypothetical protein